MPKQNIKTIAATAIENGQTLPFAAYHDTAIFQQETDNLFSHDWLFACTANRLEETGAYYAFTIINEPIVIIHGQDGTLRALSNVCRHRGTPLLDEGFGQVTQKFSCPYHSWTYDDTGQLSGTPMTGNISIDKSTHCLPQFQLERWQGLVFINLDPNAAAFTNKVAGIAPYLQAFETERFKTTYPGQDEQWHCNWKVALENAMESYHLFKVHKETLETITPTRNAFHLETQQEWTLTAGKQQRKKGMLDWLTSSDEHHDHYVLISLPPSFVGIVTYESLDWISVLPTDAEHCLVRSGSLSTQGEPQQAALDFVSAFLAEDKQICERLQRGLRARQTTGGTLVELERIVKDFHHYWQSRLWGNAPPKPYRSPQADAFLSPK